MTLRKTLVKGVILVTIKIKDIKRFIIWIFITLCILLNSSYAYVLVSDTLSLTALFLLSIFCGLYLLIKKSSFKIGYFLKQPFFYLSIIVIVLMLFDGKIQSWGAYIHIVLVLLVSIYLCTNIDYSVFAKNTIRLMAFMTIISIALWVYVNVLGISPSLPLIKGASNGYYSTYYNLGIVFMNTFHTSKIMGAFWEPGIYAATSILTLVMLEDLKISRRKYNMFRILFIVGILLSFSTTGYFCLSVYFVYSLINKQTNKKRAYILSFLILMMGLIFVLFWNNILEILVSILPTVFGKLTYDNASLLTRTSGPLLDLTIMKNNIIFGVGMSNYNILWTDIAKSMFVESRTSTITFYLANFGILGILYFAQIIKISKNRNMNSLANGLLVIIFIIIVSTEPNYFNVFTAMTIVYLSNKKRSESKRND